MNISSSGTLLVNGNVGVPVRMVDDDNGIALAVTVGIGHRIEVREGRIAGLMAVVNDLMPGYRQQLDDLANTLRRAVNSVHASGLPLTGRFHTLEGLNAVVGTDPFHSQGYGIPASANERLIINVEDEATGDLTQYELTLDTTRAADDFLTSLRDDINAGVTGVTATIDQGHLVLQADAGYAFDFATPYDPNPAQPGDISAASPTSPTIIDAFKGAVDLNYEFAFLTGGAVGTDPLSVQVTVRDSGGTILRTLTRDVDAAYDPGEAIGLENGLSFALSAGNVAAGDGFSFTARASMDTAGVMDALGLNTLFGGIGAGRIHVVESVSDSPGLLAAGIGTMPGDNHRLLDLLETRDQNLMAGGTASMSEFYRTLLGEVGTTRQIRDGQYQNHQQLLNDLENRRDSVSGVSVDEEMVRIIQAKTAYQGALKYISSIQAMVADLLTML